MKVWMVRDFEPLPIDPGHPRLMRSGLLAEALARAGHQITWFTSSFNHYPKVQRALAEGLHSGGEHLAIEVVRCPSYGRNIGIARIHHNRVFARKFLQLAEAKAERPDVLVTDVPTTEMAAAVVGFGEKHGLPTVLSIRDLWPDFFVDFLPGALRPLARLAVLPLDRQVRYACRTATSVIGISESYLRWGEAKGGRTPTATDDAVFPLGYSPVREASGWPLPTWLERLVAAGKTPVSFVGSWGNTYDLGLVLGAADRLAEQRDIVFVLAGNQDARPKLAERAAGMANVVLPGWLDGQEIAALLGRSAVGLLPYRAEAPQGLPNKLFEYMAYGAFGVSTLRGEAAELLTETGSGETTAADPKTFADAIRRLVLADSPERRGHLRAVFAARFDADAIYGRLVRHIERIAAEGV